MKALQLGDISYITWTYKNFPNIKVLSQNFPRILKFARRTISNGSSLAPSRIFNKITIINSSFLDKAKAKAKLSKEVEAMSKIKQTSRYEAFVEPNTMNVERASNQGTQTSSFLTYLFFILQTRLPLRS